METITPIHLSPTNPNPTGSVKKSPSATMMDSFAAMLSSVNNAQQKGDLAIEKLQSGQAQHLHEVILAVEEADISMRMLVQIRNKALTAYEEIMRMQI